MPVDMPKGIQGLPTYRRAANLEFGLQTTYYTSLPIPILLV